MQIRQAREEAIILDGRIVCTWQRTQKKDAAIITPTFFTQLNAAE
jgi:hypothetical protein